MKMEANFEALSFLEETRKAFDLLDTVFDEDFVPLLNGAEQIYNALDISKMDIPLSVKGMLEGG